MSLAAVLAAHERLLEGSSTPRGIEGSTVGFRIDPLTLHESKLTVGSDGDGGRGETPQFEESNIPLKVEGWRLAS